MYLHRLRVGVEDEVVQGRGSASEIVNHPATTALT